MGRDYELPRFGSPSLFRRFAPPSLSHWERERACEAKPSGTGEGDVHGERGFTFWAVERKADKALLGFCGLKIADDAGSPVEGLYEIGWRLREDAWGQGYAKEAAIASLDFAFDRLGAPRVIALTVTGNRASWGLMERLGMTRRADLDYEGPAWAEGPIIVYEIEKAAWTAQRS